MSSWKPLETTSATVTPRDLGEARADADVLEHPPNHITERGTHGLELECDHLVER